MIYLIRRDDDGDICDRLAVEHPENVARHLARGYEATDAETFWRWCDAPVLTDLAPAPSVSAADPSPRTLPPCVPSVGLDVQARGTNYSFTTPWSGQ